MKPNPKIPSPKQQQEIQRRTIAGAQEARRRGRLVSGLPTRLADLARDLWLPATASYEEVAEAIDALSDRARREHLKRRLSAIPLLVTGRVDTRGVTTGRRIERWR